ncbi:hypothetical protein Slala03_03340 [Streptomyces lavendulae subsp. lavendulae]|uniref:hypothetical protein n=1 Tax=Streptomyces lavendulae TaxID=1914 RepID=UPI0024A2F7C0|nr:hypothetical protein [Streptomyces lavendulae]GLV80645.1 hypothetical protein Slala03_03340 [Streptomyces lavendulae subsp. lavendulae]GLX35222.1 hypothetical protein Sros01_12950 [Streptomyces roseochromogenus]
MKLRNAVAATLGALALTLSMSGSAFAAEGQFHYTYQEEDGQVREAALSNPANDSCVNLFGAGADEVPAGYAPENATDSYAVLYLGADCDEESPKELLQPKGQRATDDMKVRSVKFTTERPNLRLMPR